MTADKRQARSGWYFGVGFLVGGLIVGTGIYEFRQVKYSPLAPQVTVQTVEKPLAKYAIASLQQREPVASEITVGRRVGSGEGFESYMYYFTTEGDKQVSGLINIPNRPGEYPVVVMFRGYVDREDYLTGLGTRHAGEMLARNDYITVAPDFLGYGESDPPAADSIKARFQTYTTGQDLLASIKNLSKGLAAAGKTGWTANQNRVAIWGHSNGGHIALAMLEITGGKYPTSLWAPVTKPFPYSILYYTDEFSDRGKALRFAVSRFEWDYDADKFSISDYFADIKAPIILHQGTNDDAVPFAWSDEFSGLMKELGKDITYYKYAGDDHNFSKGNWSMVVERDLNFFAKRM